MAAATVLTLIQGVISMTTKYIDKVWPSELEVARMGLVERGRLLEQLEAAQRECSFFDHGYPEVAEFILPNGRQMQDVWQCEIVIDQLRELIGYLGWITPGDPASDCDEQEF